MELKTDVPLKLAAFAAAVALVFACAMALHTPCASAVESEVVPDAEELAADAMSEDAVFSMGGDRIWFGEHLSYNDEKVPNDLIAAGRVLHIAGGEVAGSVRAAGQDVEISNVKVGENITIAGETVNVTEGQAGAIAMAGQTASFSGACSELTMYASKVFINGTVKGDVTVGSSNVEIGPDAQIAGTLHVSAPQEPVVPDGAKVGNIDFTQTDESGAEGDAGEALKGLSAALAVLLLVMRLFGTILIALLAEWLFSRHTAAAAAMMRNRTAATICSGVVGAIVAPVAIIILVVLLITLPVAIALTLLMLAMLVVAGGFMGASLSKLVFPRLGRFKAALAGGAIVSVASLVPILGTIVRAAAFMFLLGYVLQSIYLGIQGKGAAE